MNPSLETEVPRAYASATSSIFRRLTETEISPAAADRAFARMMRLRRAREIASEAASARIASMAAAAGSVRR